MKPEKISECIGLINDKYIDEAADFAVDSLVNDSSKSDIERMVKIKKSRIIAILIAAAVAV